MMDNAFDKNTMERRKFEHIFSFVTSISENSSLKWIKKENSKLNFILSKVWELKFFFARTLSVRKSPSILEIWPS